MDQSTKRNLQKVEGKTETPFSLNIIVPEILAVGRRAGTQLVWLRAGGQVTEGKPKQEKGKPGKRPG